MNEKPTDESTPVTVDELDKMMIEQLHAVTLIISGQCFELKKTCATLTVPLGTLVVLLNNREITPYVFVAPLALILAFWLADSYAFTTGRGVRAHLEKRIDDRKTRLPEGEHWEFDAKERIRFHQALAHGSMFFYLVFGMVIVVAFFVAGAIAGW